MGYKLAKLSFKGETTAETISVEEETGKMLLKSNVDSLEASRLSEIDVNVREVEGQA